MLAHLVGVPIEETALGLTPMVALGFGGILVAGKRLADAARSIHRPIRRGGVEAR